MKLPAKLEEMIVNLFDLDIEKTLDSCIKERTFYQNSLRTAENTLNQVQTELDNLKEECEEISQENTNLLEMIEQLKQGLFVQHPKEVYWNDKHPKANILYTARKHPANNEPLAIDVKLYITPNDFEIHNWLKNKNLYVQDPMKIDEIAPKIYYEHQKQWFKYAYDKDSYGQSEYWAFPWELRAMRKMGIGQDCDDWANSIISHLRAAGVPAWRVRNTCGYTTGGLGGHSTVYVLDDSLETWRHLNSTSISNFGKLTNAPVFGDPYDSIGIKPDQVWMSFNDQYAWHNFESSTAKKNFKDEGWEDKFIIKPMIG